MPTKTTLVRPPRAWKNPVFFTSRAKHDSLTQHCKMGSCLRAAMRVLEFKAAGNPQRCVYASVEEFVKECNTQQRKKKLPEYGRSAYEKVLIFLRQLDIVANLYRRPQVLVNFDGCDRAPSFREGWIVAPHDFLTHKHDGACHFVGFGNSPDYPFKPSSGPKIWVPQYGPTKPYRRVHKPEVGFVWEKDSTENPSEKSVDHTSTVSRSSVDRQSTVSRAYVDLSVESSVGDASELAENSTGIQIDVPFSSPKTCPSNTVSTLNPEKTKNPEKTSDQTLFSSSNGSLTSLEPKPRLSASREENNTPLAENISAAAFKTAHEFFKGSMGEDLLVTVTDGEFRFDRCKDFKKWAQVYSAIEGAVEKYADLAIRDRGSLAVIISDAINRCDQGGRINKYDASTFHYPKALFSIMKLFQEQGGAIQRIPPERDRWTPEEWLTVWSEFRKANPDMDLPAAAAALRKDWDTWKQKVLAAVTAER